MLSFYAVLADDVTVDLLRNEKWLVTKYVGNRPLLLAKRASMSGEGDVRFLPIVPIG
jgi:hypothetical protein